MRTQLKFIVKPLCLLCFVVTSAMAQDDEQVARGKAKYETTCAPCHAEGPGADGSPLMPAPTALTIKYRGELSPYLTKRSDLANPNVLSVWVRGGTVSMPPFRKTEVSDAEIEDIAAYFAVSSSAQKP